LKTVVGNRRTGENRFCRAPVGREDWKEGGRRINMVQIMYTLVCKAKMVLDETVPGIMERGLKENSG
jgi:hypothetical protein